MSWDIYFDSGRVDGTDYGNLGLKGEVGENQGATGQSISSMSRIQLLVFSTF